MTEARPAGWLETRTTFVRCCAAMPTAYRSDMSVPCTRMGVVFSGIFATRSVRCGGKISGVWNPLGWCRTVRRSATLFRLQVLNFPCRSPTSFGQPLQGWNFLRVLPVLAGHPGGL